MRVTNGMIRNNMLNALNTNMSRLDTLYNQMNTQKKIQRPSDDPIITGRSLKLRINVLEVEQYASNTEEAESWMSITEKALDNIHSITQDVRTRCNNAATGTLTVDDRDKLKAVIDQLAQQLQDEANVTYIGRSVFSGYKTDEPIVLTKETTLDKDVYTSSEMTLLKGTKVGTGGITLSAATTLADGTVLPAGHTFAAGTILDKDIPLPVKTIIGDGVATIGSTSIPVGSNRILTGATTLPAGTVIAASTIKLPDGTFLPAQTLTSSLSVPEGTTLVSTMVPPVGMTMKIGTILPINTVLPKGTMNPKVLGKIDGQEVQYEVGVGNTITVNTLGMDSCMNKLLKDVKDIKDKLDTYYDGIDGNEADLYALFNDKIGEFDKTLSTVSEMTADLGSKMTRVEYTASRLTDDKTNFTELLSNTEGVDLEEVYVEFNSQYQVYQSALQATSKVVMNTLADFLN